MYSGTHAGRCRLWTRCLLTGGRSAVLCAAAVGLIGLGFYLATLAPGLTWAHDSGDGGELAAAARTLGIPHPPGYPTYVLLAHLFTHLPVGEVATRTNLFSAICAAATAALLTWSLAQAKSSRAGAIGAGLALAFSPLLWSQATLTEVHALNGLSTAFLLALATLVKPGIRRTPLQAVLLMLLTGGLWGLGLGNHPTALFCAPLVLLLLWRLRRFGAGAVGIVLGLAVYLYLPLRAAADPPINWGDPRTWERFWWVISGTPYRPFVFSLPLDYLPARLLSWTGLLTQQFGWVGLMVTTLGAAVLWTADWPLFGATGTTVILCSLFAIGYNTVDSYLYLVPALVCLGLWLGIGVNWLVSALAERMHSAAHLGTVLAIALPLAAVAYRFPALDLSDDQAADNFEAVIVVQAPPKAVILSQRDTYTFALWYFQHALGRRPDVVVVDSDLLGYDWYVAHLSQRLAALALVDLSLAVEDEGLQRSANLLSRPVCRIGSEGTVLMCAEPEFTGAGGGADN